MHFHYKKIKGLFQVFWNIFFESSMHSFESKSSSGLQFKVVASFAMIWKDDLSIFPGIWSNTWMVRTFTPEAAESFPCENPFFILIFLKFVMILYLPFNAFSFDYNTIIVFCKAKKSGSFEPLPQYKTKKHERQSKIASSLYQNFCR